MLSGPPTHAQLRRTFNGFLNRAVAEGKPTSTCSGLHPDTLDAVDAVAGSWPHINSDLIAHARNTFETNEGTWQR